MKRGYCQVCGLEHPDPEQCTEDDIEGGRYLPAVSDYASTCDGCGELNSHELMWMDEATQLGYCEKCTPEAKRRAAQALSDLPTGET